MPHVIEVEDIERAAPRCETGEVRRESVDNDDDGDDDDGKG